MRKLIIWLLASAFLAAGAGAGSAGVAQASTAHAAAHVAAGQTGHAFKRPPGPGGCGSCRI
jgi:hypothetical protein